MAVVDCQLELSVENVSQDDEFLDHFFKIISQLSPLLRVIHLVGFNRLICLSLHEVNETRRVNQQDSAQLFARWKELGALAH